MFILYILATIISIGNGFDCTNDNTPLTYSNYTKNVSYNVLVPTPELETGWSVGGMFLEEYYSRFINESRSAMVSHTSQILTLKDFSSVDNSCGCNTYSCQCSGDSCTGFLESLKDSECDGQTTFPFKKYIGNWITPPPLLMRIEIAWKDCQEQESDCNGILLKENVLYTLTNETEGDTFVFPNDGPVSLVRWKKERHGTCVLGPCEVPTGCGGICGNHLQSRYNETMIGDELFIHTNGIPNYVYGHVVGRVCEQKRQLQIPKTPEIRTEPISTGPGPIGILKSGVIIYSTISEENGKVIQHASGQSNANCAYQVHRVSNEQWKNCEHIGYMRDGFPIYSQCSNQKTDHFLRSCYKCDSDNTGTNEEDYIFQSNDCELDRANGFDFTDQGFLDSNNNLITGWAYVATDTYPYITSFYKGTPRNLTSFYGEISTNAYITPRLKFEQVDGGFEYNNQLNPDIELCSDQLYKFQASNDLWVALHFNRTVFINHGNLIFEKNTLYDYFNDNLEGGVIRAIACNDSNLAVIPEQSGCLDACGVMNGDNSECTDQCGVLFPVGVDRKNWNTSCLSCDTHEFDYLGIARYDSCGICRGNGSTCVDACGVLQGDNSTCLDACGVVNGDNSTCVPCGLTKCLLTHACINNQICSTYSDYEQYSVSTDNTSDYICEWQGVTSKSRGHNNWRPDTSSNVRFVVYNGTTYEIDVFVDAHQFLGVKSFSGKYTPSYINWRFRYGKILNGLQKNKFGQVVGVRLDKRTIRDDWENFPWGLDRQFSCEPFYLKDCTDVGLDSTRCFSTDVGFDGTHCFSGIQPCLLGWSAIQKGGKFCFDGLIRNKENGDLEYGIVNDGHSSYHAYWVIENDMTYFGDMRMNGTEHHGLTIVDSDSYNCDMFKGPLRMKGSDFSQATNIPTGIVDGCPSALPNGYYCVGVRTKRVIRHKVETVRLPTEKIYTYGLQEKLNSTCTNQSVLAYLMPVGERCPASDRPKNCQNALKRINEGNYSFGQRRDWNNREFNSIITYLDDNPNYNQYTSTLLGSDECAVEPENTGCETLAACCYCNNNPFVGCQVEGFCSNTLYRDTYGCYSRAASDSCQTSVVPVTKVYEGFPDGTRQALCEKQGLENYIAKEGRQFINGTFGKESCAALCPMGFHLKDNEECSCAADACRVVKTSNSSFTSYEKTWSYNESFNAINVLLDTVTDYTIQVNWNYINLSYITKSVFDNTVIKTLVSDKLSDSSFIDTTVIDGSVKNITNVNVSYSNFQQLYSKQMNNVYFANAEIKNAVFTDFLNVVIFSDAKLRNIDFSGVLLSDVSFVNAIITDVDFSGAVLDNVDFSGAVLTNVKFPDVFCHYVNFSGVIGLDIIFSGSTLENVNFVGSVFNNLDLYESTLVNSTFATVEISTSDWSLSNWTNVDLSGAKLKNILNVVGTSVYSATYTSMSFFPDVSVANLTGIHMLNNAYLPNSDWSTHNKTGWTIINSTLDNSTFIGQPSNGVYFSFASLIESNFTGAPCKKCIFNGSDVSASIFVGANLVDAVFTDVNAAAANFSGATLTNVTFINVDLTNVDFSGADLSFTRFQNTSIENVNFHDVNTYGISISEVYGQVLVCPSILEIGYICLDNYIVGPDSFSNVNTLYRTMVHEVQYSGTEWETIHSPWNQFYLKIFTSVEHKVLTYDNSNRFLDLGNNVITLDMLVNTNSYPVSILEGKKFYFNLEKEIWPLFQGKKSSRLYNQTYLSVAAAEKALLDEKQSDKIGREINPYFISQRVLNGRTYINGEYYRPFQHDGPVRQLSDPIEASKTDATFLNCSRASLPDGYICIKTKYVFGPYVSMVDLRADDFDFQNMSGRGTRWYNVRGRAENCPLDMEQGKSLAEDGVFCLDGYFYGKGDIHMLERINYDIPANMDFTGLRPHWVLDRVSFMMPIINDMEKIASDSYVSTDGPFVLYDSDKTFFQSSQGYSKTCDVWFNDDNDEIKTIRQSNIKCKDGTMKDGTVAAVFIHPSLFREKHMLNTTDMLSTTDNRCRFLNNNSQIRLTDVELDSFDSTNFSGVDLSNLNFHGIKFNNVNFKDVISLINTTGVIGIDGSHFEDVNVNGFDLKQIYQYGQDIPSENPYVVGNMRGVHGKLKSCPQFGGSSGNCRWDGEKCLAIGIARLSSLWIDRCSMLSIRECDSTNAWTGFHSFKTSYLETAMQTRQEFTIDTNEYGCSDDQLDIFVEPLCDRLKSIKLNLNQYNGTVCPIGCVKCSKTENLSVVVHDIYEIYIEQPVCTESFEGWSLYYGIASPVILPIYDGNIFDINGIYEYLEQYQHCDRGKYGTECDLFFPGFEQSSLTDESTYYCIGGVFVGPFVSFENTDLSETSLDSISSYVLKSIKKDNVKFCPQTLPFGWSCHGEPKKIVHVHYGLLEDNPQDCCEGIWMHNQNLEDIYKNQNGKNFTGAIWNGVYGSAMAFRGYFEGLVTLSPEYRVIEVPYENDLALVGPRVSLRNRNLLDVNLKDIDLSGTDLLGIHASWTGTCGTIKLPAEWKCLTRYLDVKNTSIIVGPYVDLIGISLNNFNLSGVSLENAFLDGVHGHLDGCPSHLPEKFGCNEKDKVILGPGVNLVDMKLTELATTPQWSGNPRSCPLISPEIYECYQGIFNGWQQDDADFSNKDLTGLNLTLHDFTNSTFNDVYGQTAGCPILPDTHICIDNYIVGPNVNLTGVNMTEWDLNGIQITNSRLIESFGVLKNCPETGIGYTCLRNRIIGMGASLIGIGNVTHLNVKNVDFSQYESVPELDFYGAHGLLHGCFSNNKPRPFNFICIQNRIIGPGVNLDGIDLSNDDIFSLNFTDIRGIVKACPPPAPYRSDCVCTSAKIFACKNADLSNYNLSGINFNGVNIEGIDFGNSNVAHSSFQNTYGQVKACPEGLDANYKCLQRYIIGNGANGWSFTEREYGIDLTNLTLSSLKLHKDDIIINTTLSNVHLALDSENVNFDGVVGNRVNCINASLPPDVHCLLSSKSEYILVMDTIQQTLHAPNFQEQTLNKWNCSKTGGIIDGRFRNVHFQDCDFSECTFSNVLAINTTGNPLWPSSCREHQGLVLCHATTMSEDYRNDVLQPFSGLEISFTGQLHNINITGVDLSNMRFSKASMINIYGKPHKCPRNLPRFWYCEDGVGIFGKNQDMSGYHISNRALMTEIDISYSNITGITFQGQIKQFDNNAFRWQGDNIIGYPADVSTDNTTFQSFESIGDYYFISNSIIGPHYQVGFVSIDIDQISHNMNLNGTDFSFSTFTCSRCKFKININNQIVLPIGYKVLGNYVIGPGLEMPTQQEYDYTKHQNDIDGLAGPLKRCVEFDDYSCYNNWLLGPRVSWNNFNWTTETPTDITFCKHNNCPSPSQMTECSHPNCVLTKNKGYVLLAPYTYINHVEIDLNGQTKVIDLQNVNIGHTQWTNGKLHISGMNDLTVMSDIEFHNVEVIIDTECPDKFKPRACDTADITCWNSILLYNGYKLPPNTLSGDFDVCLRGLDLSQITPNNLALLRKQINDVKLPDDSSGFIFNEHTVGLLRDCPTQLPHGWFCSSKRLISNNTHLLNTNVTGINFENISFGTTLSWSNVYGKAKNCPMQLPDDWACKDGIFFGKNTNYNNYSNNEFGVLIPDKVDLSGVDMSGSIFNSELYLKSWTGMLKKCPKLLPAKYNCIKTDHESYAIIGPYIDVSQISLHKDILITDAFHLEGIHGSFRANVILSDSPCPTFDRKMTRMGYACSIHTDYTIVGPSVDLSEFNLELLNGIEEIHPDISLNYAIYYEHYFIDIYPTDEQCSNYESVLINNCEHDENCQI